MKKIVALAAFAALAACSQAEEADDTDTMADETSVTEQAPAVADEGPGPGDYVATYPDGSEIAYTTTADGTWTGTMSDGTEGSGTFEARDGKTCFVSNPPSDEDNCWSARVMNDDGTWTSTNDDGVTVTVRPAA